MGTLAASTAPTGPLVPGDGAKGTGTKERKPASDAEAGLLRCTRRAGLASARMPRAETVTQGYPASDQVVLAVLGETLRAWSGRPMDRARVAVRSSSAHPPEDGSGAL